MRVRCFELVPGVIVRVRKDSVGSVTIVFDHDGTRWLHIGNLVRELNDTDGAGTHWIEWEGEGR